MAEHHDLPLPAHRRRPRLGALSGRHDTGAGGGTVELCGLLLACVLLGPLALAAALILTAVFAERRRSLLYALALPAAAAAAAFAPAMRAELIACAAALHGARDAAAFLPRASPALLRLWLQTLCLSPLLSVALLRRAESRAGGDPDAAARRRLERAERRLLPRRSRSEPPPALPGAVFLGYRLRGDPLLPVRRGRVYLPLSRLGQHLLVVGATGSGKTETVLRLVDSLARTSDWRVVYLDGKGDPATAERFAALAQAAGRRVWRFPEAAYDGWRGGGAEVAARLLELIDFAERGGGTYYRDLAINAIQLACRCQAGPPRSSTELLRRLERDALLELHPAGSLAARQAATLQRGELDGVRARYGAFFSTVGRSLDGRSAFDELDCSFFLLDGLALKQEAGLLARFLVEDFTQWAVSRKPREQRVLLVVDEFSALAAAARGLVDVVERTRSFGVGAVLCPQLAEGMGDSETAARLIGSARTLLLHALATPERFTEAAGGRLVALRTDQLEGDAPTGAASQRTARELRVDPDEVRRLAPGQCFAIGSGLAQKLQISPLPAPQAPDAAGAERAGGGDAHLKRGHSATS